MFAVEGVLVVADGGVGVGEAVGLGFAGTGEVVATAVEGFVVEGEGTGAQPKRPRRSL